MRRKSFVHLNATVAFLLIVSGLVFAHDLWLVPATLSVAPGTRVAVMLNTGDTFPISDAAVKPERIERAGLTSADGSTPLTIFRTEGNSTVADVTAPRKDGGAIVEIVLKPIATKQPLVLQQQRHSRRCRACARTQKAALNFNLIKLAVFTTSMHCT